MAGLDQRDARTWIAIELTPRGEDYVQDGSLPRLIRKDLGVNEDHEVFVPAVTYVKGSRTTTVHLIEGYVFVASGLEDVAYFRLENRSYVSQVMSNLNGHDLRSLSVIPDSSVQELKDKLHGLVVQNIDRGSWVRVCEGKYHDLCGQVMGLDDDHAFVRVSLRSLKFIANIPRVFLELEDRPEDYAQQVGTTLIQVAPPTAAYFYDPVISVLGVFTEYTPERFVPYDRILPAVLKEVGISSESPPYGWKLHGREGLYRRVSWAFRNQRPEYIQNALTLQGSRGLWGLTQEGVERSAELNQIPSAQFFYPHVLIVLGRLTNYSDRVLVPFEDVIHLVLINSGINPDHPQRGWSRKGRHGLDRRVGWAHRNQRAGYCAVPLTVLGEKGEWGLTRDGVIQARRLVRQDFESTVGPEIL